MLKKTINFDKDTIRKGLLFQFNLIHPNAFSVFLALCSLSEDNVTVQVGAKTLMELTGISRRTFFKCTKGLEEENHIKKLQVRKGRKQVYQLIGVK